MSHSADQYYDDEESNATVELRNLIGKTIESIAISKGDRRVLALTLRGEKPLWIAAEGDCCSDSWFEHISGVEFLIGHAITGIVGREMPEGTWTEPDGGGDNIQYYGWAINTTRGSCDLEMRNRSNGYYGGSIEILDEEPRLGDKYWNEGAEENKMVPLTEDF